MTVTSMINRWSIPVTVLYKSPESVDVTGSLVESNIGDLTTAFVQVRGNSDGVTGGAERSTRTATVYFKSKKNVRVRDRLTFSSGTFEVTSVRTPDERASNDPLCYTIVDVTEVFG